MRISAINTYNVKSSQNNIYNSKNKNNNIKNNAPSFSGHGANPIITNERGDVSCYILGEDLAPYFRDYNVNIKKDSVDKISQYLANNVQMYTEKFDKNRTFEKTENKYNTKFYIADPNEKITDKIRDEYGYIVYDNEPPFPTIEQLKDKYTSRKAVPHDYFADLTNYITYQQRVISADENSLEYPDDDYTAEQGDMYSSRINKAQQKIIYAQSLFNMMYKTGQEFIYKDELVNRLADLKAKYNSADFKLENIAFEKYLNDECIPRKEKTYESFASQASPANYMTRLSLLQSIEMYKKRSEEYQKEYDMYANIKAHGPEMIAQTEGELNHVLDKMSKNFEEIENFYRLHRIEDIEKL